VVLVIEVYITVYIYIPIYTFEIKYLYFIPNNIIYSNMLMFQIYACLQHVLCATLIYLKYSHTLSITFISLSSTCSSSSPNVTYGTTTST